MDNEIKINKANKSLTFINNGIAFSQFGIADEILDLITNLEKERNMFKGSFEEMSKNYFEEKSKNEKAIAYVLNYKNNGEFFSEGKLLNILERDNKNE